VQSQTLSALDARLEKRDTVLRVSTGGGKTVVGLVYLYHLMRRDQSPSVYLVPTVQLLQQVLDEAERIGVPAFGYLAGEQHPNPSCTSCEAVLVCTYDKFFNGLSTFSRTDVALHPGAIVLDDVHAGIESVRRAFNCKLSEDAFRELKAMLAPLMKTHVPGVWAGVEALDASASVEVPFWIWQSQLAAVQAMLNRRASESDMKFAWRHLADHLDLCRAVISGTGAEVALDPPAVERVRHYAIAKHRLFMSASINDGSSLVRELDCDPAALSEQVGASFDSGPGERLILTTTLIDPSIKSDAVGALCAELARSTNVVVLVPSERAARPWISAGAKLAIGDEVPSAVEGLRSRAKGSFLVLAQRYDGIDLPDDACRVLVLDGLPRGDGILDAVDHHVSGHTVGIRNRLVNRLEQGLGRGVRSPVDYCAVILVGPELGQFISQRSTMELLGPATRKQIEMSKEISASAANSVDPIGTIRDTVFQALRREPAWRQYYAQKMRSTLKPLVEDDARAQLLAIAVAERRAQKKAMGRDLVGAAQVLQDCANNTPMNDENLAPLLQRMAGLVFHHNEADAHQIQRKAYAKSLYVCRPIDLLPAAATVGGTQVSRHSRWLNTFAFANGAVSSLNSLRAELSFSQPALEVEDALMRLGLALGADASRPEKVYGRGPDVLWRFEQFDFVIEAKTERRGELPKADAAQLKMSLDWYKAQYPNMPEPVPLIVSDAEPERREDFNFGVRRMKFSDVDELVTRLTKSATTQITDGAIFAHTPDAVRQALYQLKLLPNQIRDACKML
jgi:hypothetical protein